MQPVSLQTQQLEAGQLQEGPWLDILQQVVVQVEPEQRGQAQEGVRGPQLCQLVIAQLQYL